MMKLTHLANAKLKDGTFKNIKLKNTARSATPTCWVLAESEIQRVSASLMVKIDTLLFSLNPIEKDHSCAFGHLYNNSVFI